MAERRRGRSEEIASATGSIRGRAVESAWCWGTKVYNPMGDSTIPNERGISTYRVRTRLTPYDALRTDHIDPWKIKVAIGFPDRNVR